MDQMDLPPGFAIPHDATEALWLDGRYGTQAGCPVAAIAHDPRLETFRSDPTNTIVV